MFCDDMMLLSGNDIPFPEAGLMVHQLTPKDIGYITERNYFLGVDLLNFSKDKLAEEDKNNLVNHSDFEIFMSIMMDPTLSTEIQERVDAAMLVLSLLFPHYSITVEDYGLVFTGEEDEMPKSINVVNFEQFKEILQTICLLNKSSADSPEYNPGGSKAKALAEKFKRRRQKLNNGKGDKVSVYSRYASILAVALQLPLNEVLNYTLYQIDDQIERFNLYDAQNKYFSAQVAGASGMDKPEVWMKDIHT